MLDGVSTDPDVERLLEGVAFLTAQLRQKLDDEFPEIIHELVKLIWPHYLRPIPATSIIAFKPKPSLKQSLTIPSGIQVSSRPVEGTSCQFKTCYPVDIHPVEIVDAAYVETAGRPPRVTLGMQVRGMGLSDWQVKSLRFYLSGQNVAAMDLYLLLSRYLQSITLRSKEGGATCVLESESVQSVGFSDDESLIPYPGNAFPGYRVLQEYFILPEKFLFVDISGWELWQERGDGNQFEIDFEFKEVPFSIDRITKNDFVLSATPVINIFSMDADPIRMDHHRTEYRLRPSGSNASHYQIYSVDNIVGHVQGTAKEREYIPFELFVSKTDKKPVFHTHIRSSLIGSGFDVYLSIIYPAGSEAPYPETLSIQLQCTNGFLPENLHVGDICIPTGSTPEYVEFKDLRAPTSTILPSLGSNLLWHLISNLSLNLSSISSPEKLQALLGLYNFEEHRDRPAFLANQKRIAGIEDLQVKASDRLVGGVLIRGQEIHLRSRQDHFSGPGDLFLFGCILDYFLGSYASINAFTQFSIKEVLSGDRLQWRARLGEHPLL